MVSQDFELLSQIYKFQEKMKMKCMLGAVHKLHLQEEGGRWSKHQLFVNFYTLANVNRGGVGGQKRQIL